MAALQDSIQPGCPSRLHPTLPPLFCLHSAWLSMLCSCSPNGRHWTRSIVIVILVIHSSHQQQSSCSIMIGDPHTTVMRSCTHNGASIGIEEITVPDGYWVWCEMTLLLYGYCYYCYSQFHFLPVKMKYNVTIMLVQLTASLAGIHPKRAMIITARAIEQKNKSVLLASLTIFIFISFQAHHILFTDSLNDARCTNYDQG